MEDRFELKCCVFYKRRVPASARGGRRGERKKHHLLLSKRTKINSAELSVLSVKEDLHCYTSMFYMMTF